MADISQVKLPNGDTYNLVDETSGYIKSYTDENVKQTPLNGINSVRYLIGGSGTSQTSGVSVASGIYMNDVNPSLTIGLDSQTQELALLNIGINFIYHEGNKHGHLRSAAITTDRTWTLPDETGTIALTSDLPDTSSFLTSETDPVFSASAAAGITATDISNWNAKVSDDKTWNGVSLNKTATTFQWMHGEYFVPIAESTAKSTMYYIKATSTPTVDKIPKYDANSYLYSKTPSANDNSTKVATTAYVDNAVPKIHIIDLTYENTVNDNRIYSSNDTTCAMVKGYIDNNELVILKISHQFYYFQEYDRGTSDLAFTFPYYTSANIGTRLLLPYKESTSYTNKWILSESTLPIYDGTVE